MDKIQAKISADISLPARQLCQLSEALRQARFRITGEKERFTGIEDPRASGTTQRYFLLAPISRGDFRGPRVLRAP